MMTSVEIEAIAEYVERNGPSEITLTSLRRDFPDYHFTYCMDDDVHAGRPYIGRTEFNIYLVNSSDHCSVITPTLENASGAVIAEVFE